MLEKIAADYGFTFILDQDFAYIELPDESIVSFNPAIEIDCIDGSKTLMQAGFTRCKVDEVGYPTFSPTFRHFEESLLWSML